LSLLLHVALLLLYFLFTARNRHRPPNRPRHGRHRRDQGFRTSPPGRSFARAVACTPELREYPSFFRLQFVKAATTIGFVSPAVGAAEDSGEDGVMGNPCWHLLQQRRYAILSLCLYRNCTKKRMLIILTLRHLQLLSNLPSTFRLYKPSQLGRNTLRRTSNIPTGLPGPRRRCRERRNGRSYCS
jgi:hypothetical protein